jgi:hypothetical protein
MALRLAYLERPAAPHEVLAPGLAGKEHANSPIGIGPENRHVPGVIHVDKDARPVTTMVRPLPIEPNPNGARGL